MISWSLAGMLIVCLIGCSGNGSNLPDGGDNNGNNGDNPPDDGNGIGVKKLIVKSNGTTIGTLLEGNGYSYTFVNSMNYIGTINPVTGYLNYRINEYYETNDCTGQDYYQGWTSDEYPLSTYQVFRSNRYPDKMYHTTSNIPVERSICSYWNWIGTTCYTYNQCNSYWTQPISEITEATSGIKMIYDPPIEIAEE